MKTIEEWAAEASRSVGRWYGRSSFSDKQAPPPLSCAEWFVEHWRRFPSASPDGGTIIDGTAVEIVGFLE